MRTQKTVASVLCLVVAGCGHYPSPLRTPRDISHASSSETMVVIVGLPLEEWPKLQKFTALEHFRIADDTAYQVRDEHIKALSELKLPKLRDVSFAHCTNVTDAGVQSLAAIRSIRYLQLTGVGITDRGISILANESPNLEAITVWDCGQLTMAGFLTLTNSHSIDTVGISVGTFPQAQIEGIISAVTNVTWWTISDPHHRLDQESLRRRGESRQITVQLADENNYVTGITRSSRNNSMPATH